MQGTTNGYEPYNIVPTRPGEVAVYSKRAIDELRKADEQHEKAIDNLDRCVERDSRDIVKLNSAIQILEDQRRRDMETIGQMHMRNQITTSVALLAGVVSLVLLTVGWLA